LANAARFHRHLRRFIMLEFLAEGGFAMLFLLAFGLASLAAAIWYARRVTRVAFRVTLGLAAATTFTTLMGICVDFAAVGHGAMSYLAKHPEESLPSVLLQGLAEALAPGVLGFSLLALTALVTTVGLYREPSV
jgi:hypothetical protein